MSDARAINAAIRRGQTPSDGELQWFAQGLADGSVSDAQAGAFAMGVCLRGLSATGRVGLTRAMQNSGRTLHWDLPGPVLDKHSTGGVADCVSLVLAPALAACGAYVPMISGRGLGHTGGTLDKMESIPGVSTTLEEPQFRQVVKAAGCAIVSATADIAPADKRLYAIRDVTATVESLDLITASILSKKLAVSPDGLVLDVKVGSGAFMKSTEDARELAKALVETANAAGCLTSALITDMDQPLVPVLGNALEVDHVMKVLSGQAKDGLFDLCCALGGTVLATSGVAETFDDGAERIARAIETGKAIEVFGKMVNLMGGPLQFTSNWQRFLPEASVIREITATKAGYVSAIDGEALGLTVVGLGGGRQVETDLVDPAVGLSDVVRLGDEIRVGQTLARVHASREAQAEQALRAVQSAITISPERAATPALIRERVT